VDALAEELPDEALQTQVEDALNPVLELINNAENFDEINAAMDGLFDKMDTGAVQDGLEKSMLIGEVFGRISANAGTGE
jgi:phage gp29-like protein